MPHTKFDDNSAYSWVVVSTCNSIASLQSALNNFPTPTKDRNKRHFVSGTLIVSGKGQNTPMNLYKDMAFGFTIDPEKVNLLFAAKEDFYSGEFDAVTLSPSQTNVILQNKQFVELLDEEGSLLLENTEHKDKEGLVSISIVGEARDKIRDKFFTNTAQWDYEKKTWNATPTFSLVAANTLRRQRKNPAEFLYYNESKRPR